jgi:hypothetical protein
MNYRIIVSSVLIVLLSIGASINASAQSRHHGGSNNGYGGNNQGGSNYGHGNRHHGYGGAQVRVYVPPVVIRGGCGQTGGYYNNGNCRPRQYAGAYYNGHGRHRHHGHRYH